MAKVKQLWCDQTIIEISSKTFWEPKEVLCRVPGTTRCKQHPLPRWPA